ncbi:hypothetical protein EYF80_017984 [Liparis tanakae]|uniref:Uncharacterized protein n=1 Tax=Liparis tanakae TaxID=230148 RepID=A0A4Z2I3J7_9TELE|nr:hypothetical protein EYF80_017984 [Liparis tanakae]
MGQDMRHNPQSAFWELMLQASAPREVWLSRLLSVSDVMVGSLLGSVGSVDMDETSLTEEEEDDHACKNGGKEAAAHATKRSSPSPPAGCCEKEDDIAARTTAATSCYDEARLRNTVRSRCTSYFASVDSRSEGWAVAPTDASLF